MATMTLRALRVLIAESLNEDAHPVSEEQAKQLLKKFPKGLRKLGIDPNRVDSLPNLGTGTHGTALDLGNGKVLKITDDQKEAQVAAALKGKDLSNIVRYYAVFSFKDSPFFGVLQEKLKPLPKEVGNEFNEALVATGLPIWIKRAAGDFENAKKLTKEYVLSQIKKKFAGRENSPEAQQYARGINEKWNLLIKKFGLRDMFNTLTQLGIDFHDYHAGNLMQREDGSLVLIDLGMSKLRGGHGDIETMNQAAMR